ncbi:MAG: TIGR04086 family membrane protein [Clostridia bacterium]|nr:TIGR04086 family membrane protein [Clostridia bacterium]
MIKLKYYSINMVIAFIISIVLLFISSTIFAYTNINDIHMDIFVFASVVISVLVGATLTARKMKSRGLIYGIVFGILYCLIIYLFTVMMYRGFFISNTLLMYFGISALSGVVGGIIRS